MPIEITQYGGYTGSYAGDCCVIGEKNNVFMIDLGRNLNATSTRQAGTQAKRAMSQIATNCDLDLLLTHFHADHINDGNYWNELTKRKAKVHHGEAATPAGSQVKQTMQKAIGANATQYAPYQNGKLAVIKKLSNWQIEVFLIVPDFAQFNNLDENDASLGAIIELTSDSSERINILTIGDMSPRAGDAAVASALNLLGYGPGGKQMTSVKLSHHGSESNFLPVLDGVINAGTTVLISGYTMTGTGTLVKKLALWKPKKTVMLFDPAGKQEFDANFPIGSQLLKGLVDAGVQFMPDFYVLRP